MCHGASRGKQRLERKYKLAEERKSWEESAAEVFSPCHVRGKHTLAINLTKSGILSTHTQADTQRRGKTAVDVLFLLLFSLSNLRKDSPKWYTEGAFRRASCGMTNVA